MQFGLQGKIQEGIFYDKMSEFKKYGNHSCAILFLRVLKGHDAQKVADALKKIWDLYQLLKKGTLMDISDYKVPSGGITVLIGFGSDIFKIPKVKRMIPRDLTKVTS